MKKVLLASFCVVLCLTLSSCTLLTKVAISNQIIYDTNIANYDRYLEEVGYAKDVMPSLAKLTTSKEIKFSYQESSNLLFTTKTLALFVQYDIIRYYSAKAILQTSKDYLQAPVLDSGNDGYYIMPVTEINYKGYNFKVLDLKLEDYYVCKSFGLIGFDDENYRISYLYFYDSDLDYICGPGEDLEESLIEFLDEYFYWNDFK